VPFQITFQRVQPQGRLVQVLRFLRHIKHCKDHPKFLGVCRLNAPSRSRLVEGFKPFVPKSNKHEPIVSRIGTRYNRLMRWSITSGSVMADTKLPLTTWFRAMHLMTSTKQCISAVELGCRLGVSYPTAWYLHKGSVANFRRG
jgi:hypothetical protein